MVHDNTYVVDKGRSEKSPGSITLTALNDAFYAKREQSSGANYPEKLAYRKHVCSEYGDLSLEQFNSTMALRIRSKMIEHGYRPPTINGIISTGKREYRYAVESGMTSENPWVNIPLLSLDDDNSNHRLISEEDLKILNNQFDQMATVGNFMKLELSINESISQGMLLAARVSDLDEEASTLIIRGRLIGNDAKFMPQQPFKMHLTSYQLSILQTETRFRSSKRAACLAGEWKDDPDYIFCDWKGNPLNRTDLNSYLRVIQLNTGFSWFTNQRLHGHAMATSHNTSGNCITHA